jgi:energy-coupling factor transport system permease protein
VNREHDLDPRAWLLWGVAASLPPLLGRNPWALAASLLAALGVWAAWVGGERGNPRLASWATLARWAALFAAVGAVFNLLTVPVGDVVLVELPPGVPLLGEVMTLNALVYGLLSGLALITLVLIGTTLAAVLDWAALLRLLPDRVLPLAVAGTIAFAYVPQTAVAFREIREAQAARGFRLRGARDLVPILVPLLSGGLERAMTLAEALEARAFGAPLGEPDRAAWWRSGLLVLGLGAGVTGGYLLAVGLVASAGLTLGAGAAAVAVAAGRRRGPGPRRTRYRPARWRRADTLVATASALAAAIVLVGSSRLPEALRYEPYPRLTVPAADPLLLLGIGLLLTPVVFAPTERGRARSEGDVG